MSGRPHPLSVRPYNEIVLSGKTSEQRGRILGVLEFHRSPLNRRMIAEATRIPIPSVCWRVKGMLQSGLLRVARVAEDPVTGQETEFLESTGLKPRQMEFRL